MKNFDEALTADEWFHILKMLSADGSEKSEDVMRSILAELFPPKE